MPAEEDEEVPFLAAEERHEDFAFDENATAPQYTQRRQRRRLCFVFSLLSATIFMFLLVATAVYFGTGVFVEDSSEQRWVMTSDSVMDRFFCRWIGICGGVNWLHYYEPSALGRPEDLRPPIDWTQAWIDPKAGERPQDQWDTDERARRDIPQYVLDYAPLVYTHHDERYWPSDPAEHLANSVVRVGEGQRLLEWNLSLATLGDLNSVPDGSEGREVYLTSTNDPESRPEWMLSRVNMPGWVDSASSPGAAGSPPSTDSESEKSIAEDIIQAGDWATLHTRRGSPNSAQKIGLHSNAPAILIVTKDGNRVHAFWFFFNSFNEGNTVFGMRFGNHVGDWEHVSVLFEEGVPQEMFLSRHSWGSSFAFDAMEKLGGRPVVYSGNGSHAHYPTAGDQPYVLPLGLLKDVTSHGPLWDPALNLHAYTYEGEKWPAPRGSGTFRASTLSPRAPTSWLSFAGHWGDRVYLLNDHRQYRFFGEFHYSSGPTGPRDKNLERHLICDKATCDIKDSIG